MKNPFTLYRDLEDELRERGVFDANRSDAECDLDYKAADAISDLRFKANLLFILLGMNLLGFALRFF